MVLFKNARTTVNFSTVF